MIHKYLSHIMWPLNICYTPKLIKIDTSLRLVDCHYAMCSGKCEVQTMSHQNISLNDAMFPPCPIHLPRGGVRFMGDRCSTVLVSVVVSVSGSKCARKHIDHSRLHHYGVSGTSYQQLSATSKNGQFFYETVCHHTSTFTERL
jgi:hypothetical protein